MGGVRGREGDAFGEECVYADDHPPPASGTNIIPAQGILLKSRGRCPARRPLVYETHSFHDPPGTNPPNRAAAKTNIHNTVLTGKHMVAGCEERTGAR